MLLHTSLLSLCLLLSVSAVNLDSPENQQLIKHETKPVPVIECPNGFFPIAERCVLIDPFLEGTWSEVLYFCSSFELEIVEIDSASMYEELLKLLRYHELEERDYWIGARDETDEGFWTWESGNPVAMGSPYWALDNYYDSSNYEIEPRGSTSENCAYLSKARYYYFDDAPCTSMKSAICQTPP
ncbi:hypothetical protein Pcinc_044254 [Petrolisthes cinctipes]|uniref:C-type lectin domain-containing protein n=1 Tax=Petrolisthes cinctipes TaxID=88211 RepID=A0AAE1BE76_PETCI|nr:hypothetical protein Pcinc_044254 [Petrolisthes cinctipes]